MKSNAPWSVKGIERDARETAKEAARREGMTVGEWINQMIYNHGQEGGPQSGNLADSEVDGLRLRDLITAIEHLRNRVVEAESKNARTVSDLTRNVGGFVERIQRLERIKPAEGGYEDLTVRLERVERASSDRNRVEALKALEKAVSQVAVQFNNAHRTTITRLDSAERQLQEFAERIDTVGSAEPAPAEINSLKSAIDGLADRVGHAERIAAEAAILRDTAADSTDPAFVERTGERLRVLGDEIKRGGDQIRTLEGAITKLSGQIEAAEKRSADGVQKVAETIAEVRSELLAEEEGVDDAARQSNEIDARLAAARAETEQRIAQLQQSLEDMNNRFEALDREVTAPSAMAPQSFDDEDQGSSENLSAQDVDFIEAGADTGEDGDANGDDIAAAIDDIEEAVAALDGDAEAPGDDEAQVDPFAFSSDDDAQDDGASALADEDASADDLGDDEFDANLAADDDDSVEDFSFQLDEDDDALDDGDEEQAHDSDRGDARALLAEVRNALSGEGVAPRQDDDAEDEDPEIDDFLADFEDQPFASDDSGHQTDAGALDDDDDDDDDHQADNTASLSVDGAGGENPAEKTRSQTEADQQAFIQSARSRAREAAASRQNGAHDTAERPSRSQLTPKQRAILAARARQKRTETDAPAPHPSEESAASGAAPVIASPSAEQDDSTDSHGPDSTADSKKGGGLSKIATALSAARSRLARKKGDIQDTPHEAEDIAAAGTSGETGASEAARADAPHNDDRAALASLQSTASAKPVTLALGVAILLAIAALIFLVKDFVFKPDTTGPEKAAITTPAPATNATPTQANDAASEAAALPVVPDPSEVVAIDPKAVYLEAIAALNASETETAAIDAIGDLQDAAALGFPPAQLQLGELYKTGQGVEQDLGQARIWFRRAANGGNVLAMHRIGVMTARGDGGPSDSAEAIAWFERAANYGLVDSQYNLGAIYHPSGGDASTVQDAGKAYYWYALAARNGDSAAEPLAAGVAAALSPAQREEIEQRVTGWSAQNADETANLNASAS